MMRFEMVIGLEVHIQLKMASKIFSEAPTSYGQPPNTEVSWVDIGMPGTLPVVNRKVVEMAVCFALAVDGEIARDSFFARKNYFYPDLAKGYQISQSDCPIVRNGKLSIQGTSGEKVIHIERAHLEEDAGKSVHNFIGESTGLDYNRAGTPLLEIVSAPDFRSGEEVVRYLKTLHQLVRHLKICDGNMQEGSFRCDVNLSVREKGDMALGVRTEMKNLNSFRFIEKAIEYEFNRQVNLIQKGHTVKQETRLYDPDKNETRAMRQKEDAFDYRYFPDPDLLPISVTDVLIDSIRAKMPILAQVRRQKYAEILAETQVAFLMDDPEVADYFDKVSEKVAPKKAFNWISVELQSLFNRQNSRFDDGKFPPRVLIELIEKVDDEVISLKSAKQVMQS